MSAVRWGLLVALASGGFALLRSILHPEWTTDLDQLWFAARALLGGSDPYAAVGPGRTFDWPWKLYYPLPAVLLVTPLAYLPVHLARVVFSAIGGFVVGFAIAGEWRTRWPVLLSMAFFSVISRNQWSTFVLASAWIPVAGAVVVVKPNLGLLTVVLQDRKGLVTSLSVAAALFLIAFLVMPTWLPTWLDTIRGAPNKEFAILQPGGFLLAAAALAWRTRGGRVLLAMSLIPHTPSLYDLLPIFLAVESRRDGLVVAALTHLSYWLVVAAGPYDTRDLAFDMIARLEVLFVYIPVLALVLLRWKKIRGARPDRAIVAPALREVIDAPMTRPEALLAVLCTVSLGVQMWAAL